MTPHDDEVLYRYLEGNLAPEDAAAFEAHLASCGACREELAELRTFIDVLREPDTQAMAGVMEIHPTPDPARVAELVRLANRVEDEKAAAATLFPRLLSYALAHEDAEPVLPAEWQTCGTVHVLLTASEERRDRLPQEALALARLAAQLAMRVPLHLYHVRYVMALRGDAWRAHGDLLRHVGDFPSAIRALEDAERHFSDSPTGTFDLAIVHVIQASVLGQIGREEEALGLLHRAARVFREYGDAERFIQTRFREAVIRYEQGRIREAHATFVSLLQPAEEGAFLGTLARLYTNVGQCAVDLGDVVGAREAFAKALPLYENLGMETPVLRTRWGLARLLLSTGHVAQVLPQLDALQEHFARLGMIGDAGLVALDRAEALLLLGRAQEVPSLIRSLVDTFVASGVTPQAMRALAYLKEAAASEHVTTSAVRYVRAFLERLSRHPTEVFAPPPQ